VRPLFSFREIFAIALDSVDSLRHFPLMKSRFSAPHGQQNKQARENRHVQTVETAVPSLDEDDVLAIVAEQAVPLVLILDCVQDPHNLGAILRTADAAGVHVVVAPKDKAVGITETVRRVSVGAADHIPFAQVTNLARTMEKLKAAGVWLVGTSDHATAKSIYAQDLKGPLALVLGAEEKGMRRLTEENCDFLVSIPMAGKVECLNVSVATGVCLYEAVRQRRIADE
jgi:23S rRNA (guanosine2251-2'-O)-methyltransferase